MTLRWSVAHYVAVSNVTKTPPQPERAKRPSPLRRDRDKGETWKKPVRYSPTRDRSSPPPRKKKSYELERERRSRNPNEWVGKHLYGRDAVQEGGRVRIEELGMGGSRRNKKKDCTIS